MSKAERIVYVVMVSLVCVLLYTLSVAAMTPPFYVWRLSVLVPDRAGALPWGRVVLLMAGSAAAAIAVAIWGLRSDRVRRFVCGLMLIVGLALVPILLFVIFGAHQGRSGPEEVCAFAAGLVCASLAGGILIARRWVPAGIALVLGCVVVPVYVAGLSIMSGAYGILLLVLGVEGASLVWYRWHCRRRRGEILLAVGRMCATLTRRGLPLAQGLRSFAREAPRKQRRIIERIADQLAEGRLLSEALADNRAVFPPLYVSLVRAGERSGTLDRVLARAEEIERFTHESYADIGMKFMYPALLGVGCLFWSAFWWFRVAPMFHIMLRAMGDVNRWGDPGVVALLVLAGVFALPTAVVLFCVAVDWAFRRARLGERLRSRLPIIGNVERNISYAHFASVLSAVLESGASTREALALACDVDAVGRVGKGLKRAREAHLEGRGLAESFSYLARCPWILTRAVSGAEAGANLVDNLDRAAWVMSGRAKRSLEWLSEAVIPAAVPLVGVVVLTQAAAVIGFLVRAMEAVG
ncbi:MAG: type II secretion system F family protein [Planctomycetota bacterium]